MLIVFLWFYRYRYYLLVSTESLPEAEYSNVEGYSDKMFYFINDTVKFYLRAESDQNNAIIAKIDKPYSYLPIDSFSFKKIEQDLNSGQSENGCNWNLSHSIHLDNKYSKGNYRVILTNGADTSNFSFCIGEENVDSDFIVILPLTTWAAYNPWGGKSLYLNIVDSTNVYFTSTQRPNTGVQYFRDEYNHVDANVCANISNWYIENFNANILPDYFLEKKPELFANAKILILSYHCEYFSSEMYNRIEELVYDEQKSLISIGGNQIYWKIKWMEDFTKYECRKDMTFFDNGFFMGGMWRHNLKSEAMLLGVRYTSAGFNTFAPYKILDPDHWLYSGLNVREGDLFGRRGINDYPICGDEMDKTPFWMEHEVDIIAKGLNHKGNDREEYDGDNNKWDGSGGGDIVLREISKTNAVLSTGSIYSGSGLGNDEIFTGIIKNFIDKYYKR
jgi:N,N-dimethylformamidase